MIRRTTQLSAFTLLEMLVALALMGILATALHVSFHTGFKARTRAVAAIAPVRSATLALEVLRRDIESALPPTGVLAGIFVGEDARADDSAADADTLVFCSAVEDTTQGGPAIRKIEFVLTAAEEDGERVLVRRVTANLLAPETPEPVEETVCRNVTSLNLRYFDGFEWLDGWDSSVRENALPLAVEATLGVCSSDTETTKAEEHQFMRVFLLPCGTVPDEESITPGYSSM